MAENASSEKENVHNNDDYSEAIKTEQGEGQINDSNSNPRRFSLRNWRLWIRPLVIGIYVLTFLGFVPFFVWYLDSRATYKEETWLIALVFMVFTIPISLWTILQHLIYYTQPELQKHIIRILWMVPVYSINSWFAIFKPAYAIYFDTFRATYEAYVVYNFVIYLLNFLSSDREIESIFENKPPQKHGCPLCCITPWPMGHVFVHHCKLGVLQYTVIQTITAIIAFICELTGVYNEGSFNVKSAWLWLMLINGFSQMWSWYCLELFYEATKNDLAPLKPVGKFTLIKLVIFVSFYQSVALEILFEFIPFKPRWGWDTPNDMAAGIQDFVICIEMLIAAIAHHFIFSYKPYVDEEHDVPWYRSFPQMFDVSDVRRDVHHHATIVGNSIIATSQKFSRRKNKETNDQTNLVTASFDPAVEEAGYGTAQ